MQLVSKRQHTNNRNVVNEPITPKSLIHELKCLELENALRSIDYIDMANLRSDSKHKSKSDLIALVINRNNLSTTKEVYQDIVPTSTNMKYRNISPASKEDLTEDIPFLDTTYYIINIIHLLYQYSNNLPRSVHQRILQNFHTNQGSIIDLTVDQWLDGRIWIKVLERGSTINH